MPITLDQYIGLRLRKRRLLLNKTTDELAVVLGCEPEDIDRFESGEDRIGSNALNELGKFMGVRFGYFFERLPPPSDMPR